MLGDFLDCAVDANLSGKGVMEITRLYVHSGLFGVFDLALGFMIRVLPVVCLPLAIPNSVQMRDISWDMPCF